MLRLSTFQARCVMHGFDLPGFVAFLRTMKRCEAKRELRERLRKAKAAHAAGDKQAFLRNLEFCLVRRDGLEREAALITRARRGAPFDHPRRAGAEGRFTKIVRRIVTDYGPRSYDEVINSMASAAESGDADIQEVDLDTKEIWIAGEDNSRTFKRVRNILTKIKGDFPGFR